MYADKTNMLDMTFDIFEQLFNGATVTAGSYTYQFQLHLQNDLPSSYKDSIAKILYRVVVEGKLKGRFKKFKEVFPFTVVNHLDLNNDATINYKVPMIFEAKKKTCNGDFTLYLKTYRAFARQQRLEVAAILDNKNKMHLTKITVTLIQKLEYNSKSGYHKTEKHICFKSHSDIRSKSEEQHRIYLEIPSLIPSTVNESKPMIAVSYVLEAKVTFRCHVSLYCDIPVIITSVPVNHISF